MKKCIFGDEKYCEECNDCFTCDVYEDKNKCDNCGDCLDEDLQDKFRTIKIEKEEDGYEIMVENTKNNIIKEDKLETEYDEKLEDLATDLLDDYDDSNIKDEYSVNEEPFLLIDDLDEI